jgi:hypothetical protein
MVYLFKAGFVECIENMTKVGISGDDIKRTTRPEDSFGL